ncbi:MAG: ferritin-like domain-containing protein [Oscillospiraceae bacterium]|nr:ferritin-like domain-containing protein [Oscillospiraceae bacterium]
MEKEVWRRVAPTLNPWPGADAVGKALRDGVKADGMVLASDTVRTPENVSDTLPVEANAGSLPGAEPDPCCMGTEAENDTAVITGFVEDEQAEKRQLQALARQSPLWARQTLLTLAGRAAGRARRLIAAYYLITGETYIPAICAERIYVGKWCPALRERYHGAACTAMNYERAADGTPDPCLGELFRALSADAFECAGTVTRILERSLVG